MARILDIVFFLYFASHIPISIFVDFQSVLPSYLFPTPLIDLKNWYCTRFRDPMMMIPPAWFKSLVTCELLVQFPFFPVAAYGFFKGAKKCQWLRIPVIIYGTHVATTLIPIFSHVLLHDFTQDKFPGPKTMPERLRLMSIYSPYFIIPLMLVVDALYSSAYDHNAQGGKKIKSVNSKKNCPFHS